MGYTVSVEYLRLVMNYASQIGVDPGRIYKNSGFDVAILEKSGARIPLAQFKTIWDTLEENFPDPDLGLHAGETLVNFPGHILFLLMLNAPTLKEALEKFCAYYNLLADFALPEFQIIKNVAVITLRFYQLEFPVTRNVSEGILSAYASVLNRISENKIQFDGVYFAHPRPENISEHQRIFKAPIFFDHPENKLIFGKKYLDLPVLLSNKEILETLERMAKKLQEKLYKYGPWSEKVTLLIMNLMKGEKPEIEVIARNLAVSPRNLQLRLKKEGTTYQHLLDQVRKEQAIYFLENEQFSISEIGFLLGYAEQSVFSRAFKRWVGCTPGQYRSRFK